MLKKLVVVGFLLLSLHLALASAEVAGKRGKQSQSISDKDHEAHSSSARGFSLNIELINQEQKPKADVKKSYQWIELFSPANIPNWVLAVIAAWAGFMALKTLKAINRQADLMGNQATEMSLQRKTMQDTLGEIKTQAELMKRQADALDRQNKAIRDRERARIAVIFPPHDPDFAGQERWMTFDEPELMMPITLLVHNEGSTKAFGVRAEVAFQFQEKDTIFKATEPYLSVSVPDVIRDESVNDPIRMTIETLITGREVDALEEAKMDFYVFGEITYEDVFGFRRKTPFRFLWSVEEYSEIDRSQQFYKTWENRSPLST